MSNLLTTFYALVYGFRKVYLYNREVLDDRNLYFKHEHFKKGCPEELYEIKRQVHRTENDTRHLGAMEAPTTNEEAIQRVKLKLEEADEKSNELTRYVNHLQTVQMQQQETIDEILDKMIRSVATTEHSTNKNFAEKVNRISHVNEMNKALFYRKSANQQTSETNENESSRRTLEDTSMVVEEDGRRYNSGSEQDMLEEEYGYENDEYTYMPDSPSEAGPSSPLLSNRDKRGLLSIDTLLTHDTSLLSKRKKKE